MKAEILKMLRESEDYVSGQQICEQFGVSRTAVWKAINQLKEEGYEVEAVRNKGYRILASPDVMTEEELKSQLDTEWAGQPVYYFDETDSTNTYAKRLGEGDAPHGTLVVADMQSAGKGRRGRGWDSPSGSSIYMTILLKPEDLEPNQASMLTLVAAWAVAGGISEQTGLPAKIKWPNDIVVNGKKVCGILTEMSTEIEHINYIVCGIGINVNMTSFPEEIQTTATSLCLETGQQVRRSTLIASIMRQFEKGYQIFMQTRNLEGLQEAYNALLVNCGREVRILGAKEQYTGKALGINPQGELLVEREDGTVEAVASGEVSVRGIYGYV